MNSMKISKISWSIHKRNPLRQSVTATSPIAMEEPGGGASTIILQLRTDGGQAAAASTDHIITNPTAAR